MNRFTFRGSDSYFARLPSQFGVCVGSGGGGGGGSGDVKGKNLLLLIELH